MRRCRCGSRGSPTGHRCAQALGGGQGRRWDRATWGGIAASLAVATGSRRWSCRRGRQQGGAAQAQWSSCEIDLQLISAKKLRSNLWCGSNVWIKGIIKCALVSPKLEDNGSRNYQQSRLQSRYVCITEYPKKVIIYPIITELDQDLSWVILLYRYICI